MPRHKNDNQFPTRRAVLKSMGLASLLLRPSPFAGFSFVPGSPGNGTFSDLRLSPHYPVAVPARGCASSGHSRFRRIHYGETCVGDRVATKAVGPGAQGIRPRPWGDRAVGRSVDRSVSAGRGQRDPSAPVGRAFVPVAECSTASLLRVDRISSSRCGPGWDRSQESRLRNFKSPT